VKTTFDHAEDILRYCVTQTRVALVVLKRVTGGTLRARGAMMAVTETSSAGYISNGCVDADIIARARSGESGNFIYGEGSPYRDIILPCGGRLEISIFQNPNRDMMNLARVDLEARKETKLKLGDVNIDLIPRLMLRIAGRGAACLALAELATNSGFDVHVQSPLKQGLAGPAFYIGAMGSTRTHESRCATLFQMGVLQCQIDRIRGPIGLIPAQRDARLLAISILAEIIQTAQIQKLI